jgi:hypothetical protein
MSDVNEPLDAQEERDYSEAQDQIGRTMGLATAGDDEKLSVRVREQGEVFSKCLASVIRLTKIHDYNNAAFDIPIEQLGLSLGHLLEMLGTIHLAMVENQIYINDIRVRFQASDDTGVDLCKAFDRHGIGGLSFHRTATGRELRLLLHRVSIDAGGGKRARVLYEAYLKKHAISFIELAPIFRFKSFTLDADTSAGREFVKVCEKSVGLVEETWLNLANDRVPNPLPMRRLVTDLIELTRGDDDQKLMSDMGQDDAPLHVNHTLQVAALSLLIGSSLGLPDASLSDLGVAAMFHDVGYTSHDGISATKDNHTSKGVRALLRQRGFHEAKIRRMLVALQHHLPFNDDLKPSLFSRIIHIADDYDNLTRAREGGTAISPAVVLGRMMAAAGEEYDPVLMRLFVNRLGRYPPGTILQLDDGRWVVTTTGVRSPYTFDKPMAVLAKNADGSFPDKVIAVDMADVDQSVTVVGA